MFERIRHMLIKEFIQVFRDPRMRTVIFVIPCVQVLVIGYAVTTDVRHVPTAVCDLDNSTASRELLARFLRSGYFDAVAYVKDQRQARQCIDRGQALMLLQINRGLADDLRAGRTAVVQVVLDGTDSNTAGIVLGYVNTITTQYSNQLLVARYSRAHRAASPPGELALSPRAWFNENLESRNYFVPGVIVVVVSIVSLLLTSMGVVREKEIGTMEQILVTPITATEFILGKTLPFAIIGLVDVTIVAAVGTLWFEVPLRGNIALLYFATSLYLMTTLGIGLLISTVSQTQQQAMMSTFFFFFPAVLLSGFAFPVAAMPTVVQWITCVNPLRYFLVVLRGIFLKGIGLNILWPEMLVLGVMGVVTLGVAVRRFHKTLG
ncbi:MAG: ABC transporter permease [Thermoguttaceae bacterium]